MPSSPRINVIRSLSYQETQVHPSVFSALISSSFPLSHQVKTKFFDLAVLGSCHHSVFDYGSYGMWGALLAGGRAVLAKGFCNWHPVVDKTLREFQVSQSQVSEPRKIGHKKKAIFSDET